MSYHYSFKKLKRRFFNVWLVLFLCMTTVMAQTKINIRGFVADQNGEPLVGTTIIVKGTSLGTVTGADGSFNLSVPEKSVLVISSIGFNTVEVPATNKNAMKITLQEQTQTVDEVVVVAYGTTKKSSFTGSMTAISSDKIAKLTQSNVAASLQGMSAGVNVLNNVGVPGADPVINIRGIGSM